MIKSVKFIFLLSVLFDTKVLLANQSNFSVDQMIADSTYISWDQDVRVVTKNPGAIVRHLAMSDYRDLVMNLNYKPDFLWEVSNEIIIQTSTNYPEKYTEYEICIYLEDEDIDINFGTIKFFGDDFQVRNFCKMFKEFMKERGFR